MISYNLNTSGSEQLFLIVVSIFGIVILNGFFLVMVSTVLLKEFKNKILHKMSISKVKWFKRLGIV